MDTWKKEITVGNKKLQKKKVLQYYRNLWKKKSFRDIVRKKGVFVRASYGKPVIKRKNIKIDTFNDMRKIIHEHGVEIISPVKNIGYKSAVDVDMPKRYLKGRKKNAWTVIRRLKESRVDVAEVTDSPRGVHIFSRSKKSDMRQALERIAKEDSRFHVGRSSKQKIVLDAGESNMAIPGSLSIKGKPYKKW